MQDFGKLEQVVGLRQITTCATVEPLVETDIIDVDTVTVTQHETVPLVGKKMKIPARIQGINFHALWDTGAQVSLLSEKWLHQNLLPEEYQIRDVKEIIDVDLQVEGAGKGNVIPYSGFVLLQLQIGHNMKQGNIMEVPFLVSKIETKLPIIGSNVIETFITGANNDEKLRKIGTFGFTEYETASATAILNQLDAEPATSLAKIPKQGGMIPAHTCTDIQFEIDRIDSQTELPVVFEPEQDWRSQNPQIMIHDTVINLKAGINNKITIKATNKSNTDFYFQPNQIVGTVEELKSVTPAGVMIFQEGKDIEHVEVAEAKVIQKEKKKMFKTFQEKDIDKNCLEFYKTIKEMQFQELSSKEANDFRSMLWDEKDAFSMHPEDIGNVPDLELDIQTTDETPVQRNYNSIPKPLYKDVKDHIQGMLDRDWIEKSNSSWSSPIVLVKKKGGGFRLCCDYRLVNLKTVQDRHPLPRVQEALDGLQGSNYFTVLDLSRAYYQGFLKESSRHKSSFVTPFGFYRWKRIPFGLKNAVPVFQRYMNSVLEPYRNDFALPYLDDTIIFSKTIEEHIKHIQLVLKKFKAKGLKLNIAKCLMFQKEVNYLGRTVSREGYKMDERNVEAVKDLTKRKYETVGHIRQLMGLLSFHRRHIQDFATLSKPLSDLLEQPASQISKEMKKKGGTPSKQKIIWEDKHQKALTKLVKMVTNPPILAYPDMTKHFFIHTDASAQGLGAILYQEQNYKTRVIAYASRTLAPTEKNYHSTKLELLAMKWSICTKFKDYLSYADHFDVYSDNNPLLFVMTLKKPNTAIQRWISELAEYTFSVHYRPGPVNRDADCLSRLPLDIEQYKPLCDKTISLDTFQAMIASVYIDSLTFAEPVDVKQAETHEETASQLSQLMKDQREDEYIKPVLNKILGNNSASPDYHTTESKLLLKEEKNLFIDRNGLLRRKTKTSSQVVLPMKYRQQIYKSLHNELGHMGAERVLQLAKQRVYWPKMQSDIEDYTQRQCVCLTQRRPRTKPVAPLKSIHSTSPMELVAIDFLKLDKASNGSEYILLIVDHFTRYAQAYSCKNKSSLTAAKKLYDDFMLKFGIPSRLLHDQGREFENSLFKHLESLCGITRSRTTPYHPAGNGLVERMNSTLLQMLRTLPEDQKSKWPDKLNKLMFAYNATKHTSTGYSPYYLLFGRKPVLPVDFSLGFIPSDPNEVKDYNKFTEDWKRQMEEAYSIAKENSAKSKHSSEERWKRRLIATELKEGDKVLVKDTKKFMGPGKIRANWEQDVYIVITKLDNIPVYKVQKEK